MPNGICAKCTVIRWFLHPEKTVKENYLNSTHGDKLSGLLAIKMKSMKVNRRDQTWIKFRHDDFPNMLLHSVERYCNAEESPTNEEQYFARDENAVNDMQIDNNDKHELGWSKRGHQHNKRRRIFGRW